MTYGFWLAQARVHLGDAVDALGRAGPGGVAEVLAVTSGRAAVYRQFARHARLLTGEQRPTGQEHPSTQDSQVAAFLGRLQAAADDGPVPGPVRAPAARSAAVRALLSAADSLGVAGDILGSHLVAGQHTPEAVAIREGSGVVSGAAELARVVADAVAFDLAVPGWLARANDGTRTAGDPLVGAAGRVARRLPHLLAAVRVNAPPGPPLVRDLAAVPAIRRAPAEPQRAGDAEASVRVASSWLWRNPDQVRAIHLRLGTQLGFHASLAVRDRKYAVFALWRRATTYAAGLESAVPTGDGAAAAKRLDDALAFIRTAVDGDTRAPADGIAAQLPSLARSLAAGLDRAIERGELFLERGRRHKPAANATARWRRAWPTDLQIAWLGEALTDLGQHLPPDDHSAAGLAFRQIPHLPTSALQPLPPPAPPQARPGPGQSR